VSAVLAVIPPPPFQDLAIGPLSFRLYGLAIALGVLTAVWIARRRWSQAGGDPEDITTIALAAVPAGLIGARLYHVITDWSSLYSGGRWWPDAFLIWRGGLGIPGGVLLGTVVGIWMARRIGVDWRRCADVAAPAIPVAQAIGRLGNYFNQELFGRPTDLPWGLEVEPAFRPRGFEAVVAYHPTFAYEALWNLALAALIVVLGRRYVLRPGRWFAVYVAGYGLGRLWVEALRIDDATELWGLRINIWTSLLAIFGGLLWLFWGGNPVDRERSTRVRAGEPLADVLAMEPSRSQRAAAAEVDTAPAAAVPVTAGAGAGAGAGADRDGVTLEPDAGAELGDPPAPDVPAPDVDAEADSDADGGPDADVGAAEGGAGDPGSPGARSD
jgi:prolipoprotein diacylglyceryl transferase